MIAAVLTNGACLAGPIRYFNFSTWATDPLCILFMEPTR